MPPQDTVALGLTLSCKYHISCTVFHILLTLHQIILSSNQLWLLQPPPISAVAKPQYNFWTNITSYVLSHFLTPSLPCATRKPWSCHSEGMLHFQVIARANYLPKWSPGKAFGCSEVHSRNNTFFKWMIQEVFASYEKERKSDLFFSRVIPWNNPLIFCLRQYPQLASKEFIWARHQGHPAAPRSMNAYESTALLIPTIKW